MPGRASRPRRPCTWFARGAERSPASPPRVPALVAFVAISTSLTTTVPTPAFVLARVSGADGVRMAAALVRHPQSQMSVRAWRRPLLVARCGSESALLARSVDGGGWPCWRTGAELRFRDGGVRRSVGSSGAGVVHGLCHGWVCHGAAIALLGSCIRRLSLLARYRAVSRLPRGGACARSRGVRDLYGGFVRCPAVVLPEPGFPTGGC